ncbi:unnamed protein product [Cylindrotheca closterium]|uniref:Uncharacterized protein n=1 Tax=Cylindrotheca closterium TaxID=2856 RepID=A0AAD2FN49_9STRA|nr:unnamed protein product [Cylindrotheca closterium]
MDHVLDDLRTSFIVKWNELVENMHPTEEEEDDDDNDNDGSDIGQKLRAAKSQLSQLKLEGKQSKSARRAEHKKLSHELWEKQRNLHRLGRKAQRHISLYEYAVLMREAGPARPYTSSRSDTTERLIERKGPEVVAASGSSDHASSSQKQQQKQQQQQKQKQKQPPPPNSTTTLILWSQTFYGSSAFLWQLMVQSVLQVRLLKKAHLLTMFRAQEVIFKVHKSNEVKQLAAYIKSKDKMDEACIDLMQRKAEVMLQIESKLKETKDVMETYNEIAQKQRKIILKLKLRGGQAVSDQVKENIIRRRSTLIQGIEDSEPPFLAELKRESLIRLSTIAERMSLEADGPLVDKVRVEFSLDESLMMKEEEEKQAQVGRSSPHSFDTSAMGGSSSQIEEAEETQVQVGRSSPHSFDTSKSDLGESSIQFGERCGFKSSLSSTILKEQDDDDENASFVSNSTISDDELDYMPEAVPSQQQQPKTIKRKRSRAELRKSLDSIALLNRSASSSSNIVGAGEDHENSSVKSGRSNASRMELERRRIMAEERLAKSKRMSQRVSMQAKRKKAKQRLEESKKRLRGFLAAEDSSSSLDTRIRDDESYHESSTSLRSPDSVAGFPYPIPTTPEAELRKEEG